MPTPAAGYSFDEASGQALDAYGTRHVTLGADLTRVTGHTGTGLAKVTTASDSPGPAPSGLMSSAYTIEGWIRRTSNSVDGWVMEFKQSGSGDRGLLFTGGNIQSRCKNVAGAVFTVQATQPAANTAYHFACTNDGTTLRLYINATQVGTGTAFSGGVRTNSTSSCFFDTTGSETWLDDARYYNVALTQAEIAADMAAPVTSGTSLNLGLTAETDSAQLLSVSKAQTYGATLETDAARALSTTKAQAYAGAAETDTAVALTVSKAQQYGSATELGIARAFSNLKNPALGSPTETNAAHPMTWTKGLVFAVASENDTARLMDLTAGSGVSLDLARATETDAARVVTYAKAWLLPGAAESDSAAPLSLSKSAGLSRATETDAAHAMAFSKGLILARGQETDSAFGATAVKLFNLARPTESDAAWSLSFNQLLRDITVVARLRRNQVAGGVRLSELVARIHSNHITGGVEVPRDMITGSTEYVTAEIIFEDLTAADIASINGQIKITIDDTVPNDFDNPDGPVTRTDVVGGAMLSLSKLYAAGAPGTYRVWAKVTDSPEIPILKCGSFTVR